MEKHNVRILVCTHKEGPVRDDDIYMPVQVGKSASTIDLGCQGDDVGDNISGKNKTYCELTGLYWAWKNLKDVDYIGLCHYRRYFDLSPKKYIFKHIESDSITWECFVKTPSTLDFADVFTQYDVILPTARVFDRSVVDEHIFNSGFIDYMILEQVILKLYPAYRNSVLDVFYKKNYIPQRNMFIMKKELFPLLCRMVVFHIVRGGETPSFVSLSLRAACFWIYGGNIIALVLLSQPSPHLSAADIGDRMRV